MGEVWVECETAPNLPFSGLYLHTLYVRLVTDVEVTDNRAGRRVRVIFDEVDTIDQTRDKSCDIDEWIAFTKRAVRVDDKEAGR